VIIEVIKTDPPEADLSAGGSIFNNQYSFAALPGWDYVES
jgi:hypothetical protein